MIRSFADKVPIIHPSAYIADEAVVIGDVEVGANSSIWFGAIVRGDVNYIRVGSRTNIQDCTVVHVTTDTHPTILEDEITVGHHVTLHGCHVESGCLIGIGAILLDGSRIGRNSLVAAGSLITPGTDIPARSLVMGSPARIKRELTTEELKSMELNWQSYVQLKDSYRPKQA
jgi:carbonic anhydrase/acetyltransferase-like protein (isoleucine patch superfamily)